MHRHYLNKRLTDRNQNGERPEYTTKIKSNETRRQWEAFDTQQEHQKSIIQEIKNLTNERKELENNILKKYIGKELTSDHLSNKYFELAEQQDWQKKDSFDISPKYQTRQIVEDIEKQISENIKKGMTMEEVNEALDSMKDQLQEHVNEFKKLETDLELNKKQQDLDGYPGDKLNKLENFGVRGSKTVNTYEVSIYNTKLAIEQQEKLLAGNTVNQQKVDNAIEYLTQETARRLKYLTQLKKDYDKNILECNTNIDANNGTLAQQEQTRDRLYMGAKYLKNLGENPQKFDILAKFLQTPPEQCAQDFTKAQQEFEELKDETKAISTKLSEASKILKDNIFTLLSQSYKSEEGKLVPLYAYFSQLKKKSEPSDIEKLKGAFNDLEKNLELSNITVRECLADQNRRPEVLMDGSLSQDCNEAVTVLEKAVKTANESIVNFTTNYLTGQDGKTKAQTYHDKMKDTITQLVENPSYQGPRPDPNNKFSTWEDLPPEDRPWYCGDMPKDLANIRGNIQKVEQALTDLTATLDKLPKTVDDLPPEIQPFYKTDEERRQDIKNFQEDTIKKQNEITTSLRQLNERVDQLQEDHPSTRYQNSGLYNDSYRNIIKGISERVSSNKDIYSLEKLSTEFNTLIKYIDNSFNLTQQLMQSLGNCPIPLHMEGKPDSYSELLNKHQLELVDLEKNKNRLQKKLTNHSKLYWKNERVQHIFKEGHKFVKDNVEQQKETGVSDADIKLPSAYEITKHAGSYTIHDNLGLDGGIPADITMNFQQMAQDLTRHCQDASQLNQKLQGFHQTALPKLIDAMQKLYPEGASIVANATDTPIIANLTDQQPHNT